MVVSFENYEEIFKSDLEQFLNDSDSGKSCTVYNPEIPYQQIKTSLQSDILSNSNENLMNNSEILIENNSENKKFKKSDLVYICHDCLSEKAQFMCEWCYIKKGHILHTCSKSKFFKIYENPPNKLITLDEFCSYKHECIKTPKKISAEFKSHFKNFINAAKNYLLDEKRMSVIFEECTVEDIPNSFICLIFKTLENSVYVLENILIRLYPEIGKNKYTYMSYIEEYGIFILKINSDKIAAKKLIQSYFDSIDINKSMKCEIITSNDIAKILTSQSILEILLNFNFNNNITINKLRNKTLLEDPNFLSAFFMTQKSYIWKFRTEFTLNLFLAVNESDFGRKKFVQLYLKEFKNFNIAYLLDCLGSFLICCEDIIIKQNLSNRYLLKNNFLVTALEVYTNLISEFYHQFDDQGFHNLQVQYSIHSLFFKFFSIVRRIHKFIRICAKFSDKSALKTQINLSVFNFRGICKNFDNTNILEIEIMKNLMLHPYKEIDVLLTYFMSLIKKYSILIVEDSEKSSVFIKNLTDLTLQDFRDFTIENKIIGKTGKDLIGFLFDLNCSGSKHSQDLHFTKRFFMEIVITCFKNKIQISVLDSFFKSNNEMMIWISFSVLNYYFFHLIDFDKNYNLEKNGEDVKYSLKLFKNIIIQDFYSCCICVNYFEPEMFLKFLIANSRGISNEHLINSNIENFLNEIDFLKDSYFEVLRLIYNIISQRFIGYNSNCFKFEFTKSFLIQHLFLNNSKPEDITKQKMKKIGLTTSQKILKTVLSEISNNSDGENPDSNSILSLNDENLALFNRFWFMYNETEIEEIYSKNKEYFESRNYKFSVKNFPPFMDEFKGFKDFILSPKLLNLILFILNKSMKNSEDEYTLLEIELCLMCLCQIFQYLGDLDDKEKKESYFLRIFCIFHIPSSFLYKTLLHHFRNSPRRHIRVIAKYNLDQISQIYNSIQSFTSAPILDEDV